MEDEDKEMCRNCKRDIPCSNYQMHTAHCARHITLCQKCDEPVPKREFENHRCQIESSPTPPPPAPSLLPVTSATPLNNVKEPITQPALTTDMDKAKNQQQLVYDSICHFCELEFPQRDLQEHENYCGSRTEQCPECQDFVMLREWEKHQSMRLYHELAKKPSSEVFKRENSRTRSSTSNLLQRSTSGLNMSTSAATSAMAASSSFSTAKNEIANAGVGQPFGNYRTPLQESKSMKNIANRKWSSIDYSDTLGSSYANASSNTSFDRRSRGRDSFRRTSDEDSVVTKAWQRRSSSTDILSQAEEKWNTSVEEQLRLFARIEREKTKTTTTSSLISVDSSSPSINVRQRSVSRQRKNSFSLSSRSNMNVGYDEQNDNAAAAGRQSRWDSSRMTMTNADADTISIKRSESLWTAASRSKSQNQQQKSIVDRILGRKDSLGDHEMMEESDPSLPDLLPFSSSVVNGAPIDVQHEKRHDRRTSLERNFATKSSASTSSRKGSFVDRYLQKTETSAAIKTLHSLPPIELPMPAAPEVPSRRRRGSMQRTNVPTGTLIDIESTPLAPIKHERKRRTSGGLKRQQSLTRVHHEPPPPNDVYESVSDRRRKPSGTLRRQDSMTNLNRLQNEISLLQDTSSSSPYLNPIASSNLSSTTNPGRSGTYEAMATALLSEPPRRRFIDGIDNTENNRENLRDMLSKLRKDPMDDDLEKCDGEYFPCEFCGDPYPVEFIMRHQLSCDLNPTPIQEGNGFDYAEIARRAAANMALANSNG